MPEIGTFYPLIDHLDELGYASAGANGYESISFSEVESWKNLTDPHLDTWGPSMLVKLSRSYAYQANISRDVKCPEPYTDGNVGVNEAVTAAARDQKLRSVFRNR